MTPRERAAPDQPRLGKQGLGDLLGVPAEKVNGDRRSLRQTDGCRTKMLRLRVAVRSISPARTGKRSLAIALSFRVPVFVVAQEKTLIVGMQGRVQKEAHQIEMTHFLKAAICSHDVTGHDGEAPARDFLT